jgi:hypothetical protein
VPDDRLVEMPKHVDFLVINKSCCADGNFVTDQFYTEYCEFISRLKYQLQEKKVSKHSTSFEGEHTSVQVMIGKVWGLGSGGWGRSKSSMHS